MANYCSDCGSALPSDALFCVMCGTPRVATSSTPTEPVTQSLGSDTQLSMPTVGMSAPDLAEKPRPHPSRAKWIVLGLAILVVAGGTASGLVVAKSGSGHAKAATVIPTTTPFATTTMPATPDSSNLQQNPSGNVAPVSPVPTTVPLPPPTTTTLPTPEVTGCTTYGPSAAPDVLWIGCNGGYTQNGTAEPELTNLGTWSSWGATGAHTEGFYIPGYTGAEGPYWWVDVTLSSPQETQYGLLFTQMTLSCNISNMTYATQYQDQCTDMSFTLPIS